MTIWNNGSLSGHGWHAWVRPRTADDRKPPGGDWTWEAVALNASTCWQSADTEAAAQAAALAWIRERADDVKVRAEAVLEEIAG